MKSLAKKKYYLFAMALVIIGVAWLYFYANRTPKVEYNTAKVEKGVLIQTVSETGAVKKANQIDLNFLANGKIDKVNVKIGDKVVRDQILAELDYTSLAIQERQARAGLDIALANEQKILRGATMQDLTIGQTGVDQTRTALDNAKKDYDKIKASTDEAVSQAEKNLNDLMSTSTINTTSEQAVKTAQTNLANTKSTYQKTVNNREASSLVTIRDKNIVGKTALDNINRILTDENAKDTLSVQDTTQLINTKNKRDLALTQLVVADDKYLLASSNQNPETIDVALTASLNFLSTTLDSLNYCFSALEKTISSSKLSQTQIDTFKNTISGQISSVNLAISSIENSDQALTDAILNYDTAVANAEQSLLSATAGLDAAIQSARNSLSSAKLSRDQQLASAQARIDASSESLKLAEAQLNKTSSSARAEDINLVQAQVRQAQAGLDIVKNQISNSLIKAPIDGEITQVNYQVGEEVGPGKPMIVLIGNDQFEVEVDVAESDVAKIKLGNKVDVTFDAFGEAIAFSGVLTKIEPAQTVIQEVVYYKSLIGQLAATASGTEKYLSELRSGMTANTIINTDRREDVMIVPSRAIIEKTPSEKIVRVLRDGAAVEVPVTVGLRGDEGQTEIISGLNVGEEIILSVKSATK